MTIKSYYPARQEERCPPEDSGPESGWRLQALLLLLLCVLYSVQTEAAKLPTLSTGGVGKKEEAWARVPSTAGEQDLLSVRTKQDLSASLCAHIFQLAEFARAENTGAVNQHM